jgi:methionyl aminopeptidase
MVTLKTKEEIGKLKYGGKILAQILRELEKYCQENYNNGKLTTKDVNIKSDELLKKNNVEPAFRHAKEPFPTGLCISINDEVVHGVPGDKVLQDGDLVSLDLGVIYDKLFTDAAISFILGKNKRAEDEFLIETTKNSLIRGIEKALVGNTLGDIGNAIESYVKESGFKVVRDYCGHGVGYSVHEEPPIPNYGKAGEGLELKEGMVLAIEPMVLIGNSEIYLDRNGWTVKTADGKRAAHWEHTVAVTSDGPMILTE